MISKRLQRLRLTNPAAFWHELNERANRLRRNAATYRARQRGELPKATKPIAPKKRRTAAEEREKFAREFHSVERVQFVEARPCCACGFVGASENAHVGNKGAGQGRKADYDQIAPLCAPRFLVDGSLYAGCHHLSHNGQASFEKERGINLLECAAQTERDWQARQAAA